MSTTVQEDRNPYRHSHWSAPSMNQVATLLQTCARVFLVCRQILAEKGFKFHAILFTLSQVNNQQLYLRKFWEIRNAGTEYSEGASFFDLVEIKYTYNFYNQSLNSNHLSRCLVLSIFNDKRMKWL